jgi:glycosyltransferase involved in cell wall biosynthesis
MRNLKIGFVSHTSSASTGSVRSLLTLIDYLSSNSNLDITVYLPESGELSSELSNRGISFEMADIPWWTWDDTEDNRLVNQLQAARLLAEKMKNKGINFVYTNTLVINTGALAASIINAPHIWHIREFGKEDHNLSFALDDSSLSQFIEASSNRVIFNSKAVSNKHQDFITEDTSRVVYNYTENLFQEIEQVNNNQKVDVIIPFYNDRFILKCLQSVVKNKSKVIEAVYIIDDKSPNTELAAEVEQFAEAYNYIFYERNSENKGFVWNANHGLRKSRNDSVLLNTDTLVTPNWADKLKQIAYQQDSIASVTPLSNNASIYSVPNIGEYNEDHDPEITNSILEKISPIEYCEAPTAHGFCMYIKESALTDVGYFDYETFGMGYGEENDWSMRAIRKGWKNVLACKTYIYHVGRQSFGKDKDRIYEKHYKILRDRYPEYDELSVKFNEIKNPLRDIRELLKYFKQKPQLLTKKAVAMVGTIFPGKGQLLTVKAIAELDKRGIKLDLYIVGPVLDNSDYYHKILSYLDRKDLRNRVHFLGYLKNPSSILNISDALVVASANEAFGRVTVEAMQLGKPVIGSNSGGTPELINDGETGYLFEPGDEKQLADKLQLLTTSPEAITEMGKKAKNWVNENITADRYGGEILSLIETVQTEDNKMKAMGSYLNIASNLNKGAFSIKNANISDLHDIGFIKAIKVLLINSPLRGFLVKVKSIIKR